MDLPQHIYQMETIFDKAQNLLNSLEEKISEFEAFQPEMQKLEEYYESPLWKKDFEMDEAGLFPKELKRGVLSEDGIYNVLERNKELLDLLKGSVESK